VPAETEEDGGVAAVVVVGFVDEFGGDGGVDCAVVGWGVGGGDGGVGVWLLRLLGVLGRLRFRGRFVGTECGEYCAAYDSRRRAVEEVETAG